MRISTAQIFQQGLQAILDQQRESSRTQLELATGRRLLQPADDPAGAAAALDLRESLSQVQAYTENIDRARSQLNSAEGALENAADLLQRVRELAVRGNNSTVSNADREAIALELDERLKELVGVANSRNPNGEYQFAGFHSNTRPFSPDGSSFTYNGDQGQRFLRVSASLQVAVSDTGAEIFRDVRTGNGRFSVAADAANTGTGVIDNGTTIDSSLWVPDNYRINFTSASSYQVRDGGGGLVTSGTFADGGAVSFNGIEVRITGRPAAGDAFDVAPSANQDMFTTVADLARTMRIDASDPVSATEVKQGIVTSLADIDRALENVLEGRARVGARLNAVEDEARVNDGVQVMLQETLSGIEDVDIAEATSRLSRQLFALEAAQQSFARVQSLSLFQFL